jgi:putative oxidoreductase
MWFIRGFLSLLGRLMLCAIFIMAAAAGMIPNFEEMVKQMQDQNVPNAKVMLIGAIALLIVGSLLIILGFKARLGAILLLVFLGMATYYFHDFWNPEFAAAEKEAEMMHFMKNLGLGGALVFVLANGAGAWSLDGRADDTDDDFL